MANRHSQGGHHQTNPQQLPVPAPPPQQPSMQQSMELFNQIHQSIDIHKSLPWNLSIDALKAALAHVDAPETQQFLDQYLFPMINLMTQQSPAKMGNFESGVMEDVILITLQILLRVLTNKPHHLITLSRLFDPNIPFYGGAKIGYTYVPGYPAVRLHMAKRFAEAKGFAVVVEALHHPQNVWPGSDVVLNILRAMVLPELLNSIADAVRVSAVEGIEKLLLALPDDSLKRENTEILSHIVHILGAISTGLVHRGFDTNSSSSFHTFWFEHTRKVMHSGSLVVKLFAWEQLIEIINEARATRPLASSYILSGAGTKLVNGEYKMVPRSQVNTNNGHTDVTQYTMQTEDPAVPLLTLFRCTMRTKAKWWFISKADLEKPGTDKDIDYYLHKSGIEDEREPPCRGWTRHNPGMTLVGLDPPPALHRKGLVLPDGVTAEDYLDMKLLKWCEQNDLLNSVFGPGSMHREIVARSSKLLVFLAEYRTLHSSHMATIWKSAMHSTEVDIVDEVFGLLVQMASVITDSMFDELIDWALDALKQDENLLKIAHFAEKFAMDGFRYVNGMLSDQSAAKLLSLVWELYKKPAFEGLKNSAILQELLSNCFTQSGGVQMATQRILECKETLDKFAASPVAVDEPAVVRMVHTLYFLIAKHTSTEMIEKLDKDGFPQCITSEIRRYVLTNRAKLRNRSVDEQTFSRALSDRLRILRRFYGQHSIVTIPLSSIQQLSELLSDNICERDQFFLFLKSNGQNAQEAMLSVKDALNIFNTIICNPNIDWTKCGDGAFECFKAYFTELENSANILPVGTELPPKLGLETLWRIALNVSAPGSKENAINLLLDAYEALLFRTDSAYKDMLKILCDHLEDAVSLSKAMTQSASEVASRDSGTTSTGFAPEVRERVSRCVSILSSAIAKSKGKPGISHAIRGRMFRLNLCVFYRRVSSYYNPSTQSDIVRVEKGTEGLMHLDVHPLHTVQQLKDRIGAKLGYADGSATVALEHTNKASTVTDTTRVGELGLSDGSELSVSYQLTFKQLGFSNPQGNAAGTAASRMASSDSLVMHIGQLLASDYSMFDTLLTLCEMSYDAALTKEIWQLLMLIPSQVDLVEQTVEQICFPEAYSASPLTPGKSNAPWNQILRNASPTRSTYLLQVIDNLLQPAPEFAEAKAVEGAAIDAGEAGHTLSVPEGSLSENVSSRQFREKFVAMNGFPMVLNKLITTPSGDDSDIINTTACAVALHILHVLAFGHKSSTRRYDSQDVVLHMGAVIASATAVEESQILADDSIEVIPAGDAVAIGSFVRDDSELDGGASSSTVEDAEWAEKADALLMHMEGDTAAKLMDKLLQIACNAAAREDSGVVENALVVVTQLLVKVPEAAAQLTSNPQSATLLSTVLRSASKKVREMAGDFAVQVGRSQPVVFAWLLNELKRMQPSDENCSEVFAALSTLLRDMHVSSALQAVSLASAPTDDGAEAVRASQYAALAQILSSSLISYPRSRMPVQNERYVLLGLLELLENLLTLEHEAVMATPLGDGLVSTFLSEFLFTLPTAGTSAENRNVAAVEAAGHHDTGSRSAQSSSVPICDTPATRRAAFSVISAFLNNSMDSFELVLSELTKLCTLTARHMQYNWGLQVSHEVKNKDMEFSGLKNQGCTCYMNSLLQVLFMNRAFREAILSTPLPENHRNTLWHRSEVELVGKHLLFEYVNGSWRRGQVIGFDGTTARHRVQYMKADGSTIEELATFMLHEGRHGRETGRVQLLDTECAIDSEDNQPEPTSGRELCFIEVDDNEEPASEREEAAYHVLDQLQRAFCYMQLSKRRYYDPRPLVDACKTLNLNFNVYHQNDAAEFYDQLLDRLETATQGKHSKVNMWENVFLKHVFGGKWLYQKIPQDCNTYETDKTNCGHWQGSREESYLKVEILIRGKETIEQSLNDFIQGELMDGDNKINCDVCMQKKATVRRTCFGILPNTLMLHLKRFDLDFQTFETVKLNNLMSFPMRINMFKYTKEGIEATDRQQQRQAAAAADDAGGADAVQDRRHGDSRGSDAPLQYEDTAPLDDADEASLYDMQDYEYELQGVLVHAGVAQGGHYYSFVKDTDPDSESKQFQQQQNSSTYSPAAVDVSMDEEDGIGTGTGAGAGVRTDGWFKFDDDEVTPFNPQYIPLQCFGGPFSAHGRHSGGSGSAPGTMHNHNAHGEEDRTSNALMLVYSKVKKEQKADTSSDTQSPQLDLASQIADCVRVLKREAAEAAAVPPAASNNSTTAGVVRKRRVRLVDGLEAYQREVLESNLQHVLSCFLLDPDLHTFVRGLIGAVANRRKNSTNIATAAGSIASFVDASPQSLDSINRIPQYDLQWSPKDAADDLPLRTVQFGCVFLLDVVMHCRERGAVRASVNVMRDAFEAHPHTAEWFLCHTMDVTVCGWLQSFLLQSTDALARASFVQLMLHAVAVVAPKDTYAVDSFRSQTLPQIKEAALTGKDRTAMVALLLRMLLDCVFRSVNHVRTADELFVLIRDLAAIPSACYALQGLGTISFLAFFAMPDAVPPMVRGMFEQKMMNAGRGGAPNLATMRSIEYANLHQSVLEAMAALLGVPQLRKVALLQERSYWETDLVPDARDALTTIFYEASHNGGMDANDITRYFERVGGGTSTNSSHKITPLQVRSLMDRFPTLQDGRLSLEGFLQYHADTASYNPKNVWRDLHAFGFRNDLTRAEVSSRQSSAASSAANTPSRAVVRNHSSSSAVASPGAETSSPDRKQQQQQQHTDIDTIPVDQEEEVLNITENDRKCLANLQLYEVGLSASEAAARAIAKRVCLNDEQMSCILLRQALSKLIAVATESSWNQHPLVVINDFIRLLLSIEGDVLQEARLREVLLSPRYGMAIVAAEERSHPSNVRANEFNKYFLYERYVNFVQELCQVPGVVENITKLAAVEQQVRFVRGYLRLRPGSDLTENEDQAIRNSVVVVEGAGVSEADGEYTFTDVKFNAGYYSMHTNYGGKPAHFTLYKCSLKNGGYQWFLSVTPEGMEPGTTSDIDFYYSPAKPTDKLPPPFWHKLNNQVSKDPAPSVRHYRPDQAAGEVAAGPGGGAGRSAGVMSQGSQQLHQQQQQQQQQQHAQQRHTGADIGGVGGVGGAESSDSEQDNFLMVGGEGEGGADDSFTNSDLNDTRNSSNNNFSDSMYD